MNVKRRLFEYALVAIFSTIIAFIAVNQVTQKQIDKKINAVKQNNTGIVQSQLCVNRSVPGDSGQVSRFITTAENCVHAVVHVKTKTMVEQQYYNPFYEFFYGKPQSRQRPVEGAGSGVIVTTDGYIVTNNHVIENSDEIHVELNDKRVYDAEVVGRDPSTDLAVLKIDAEDLPFIPYGNSDNVHLGEWVMAIGNPFNLTSTVTAGIISAKYRNIQILKSNYRIESFLQTDAALNPGNSGGALVNLNGELIGINTAIQSPTGAYAGNSFAIPVAIVKKVVADIIEYGKVQRAILGVMIEDVDAEKAEEAGLDEIRGVYISGLREDGAAKSAGLSEGDIVIEINGIEVNSTAQIQEVVNRYRPGDVVTVTVLRNGKVRNFEVTLTNLYGNTEMVTDDEEVKLYGAVFKNVPKEIREKLRLKVGVIVDELKNGKIKNAGVQEGFIITKINNQPVNDLVELNKMLKNARGGVYVEGVYPNGVIAYYAFGVE